MEYTFNRCLCRLCLCYAVSFVDIFRDDASQEYNLTTVILELLELKVSEEDGYPKALCSACFKTIIDFKKFKEGCQKAKITYDMNIRTKEIPDVNRPSQEINQSQQESSEIVVEHGNKEKCTSPAVLSTDFEMNQESNPVEPSSENINPLKCLEFSKEFSRKSDNTHHSTVHKSVTSSSTEQKVESGSSRPTDLEQKRVKRVKPKKTLLQYKRKKMFDFKSRSRECNGTTPVESFQTVTTSELDKSNEDEIKLIQQGDSLIESEFQSGKMTTMKECHSFDKEKELEGDVSWKSRSSRSTDLEQKEVNTNTPKKNLLQYKRKRMFDFKSRSRECNGNTSVESFQPVTRSKLDKSNEDEIELIQQGDSLVASEFQSGKMMTMKECQSFDKEKEMEGGDVSWKLRNSDVKKGKDDEGDGMLSHYNCDHCSEVFNDIRSLNMHLSLHERDVSIEGKEVTSTNAEVNKNTNDNIGKISHSCRVCGKSFKEKCKLKVHLSTHPGETPYKCRVCHQMFRHKINRDKHVVHIHENYRCSYCCKLFYVKDELAEHVRKCKIKREFNCNWYNMCSDDNLSHIEQLSTHTTEEVFKCHYCDKSFSRRDVLSVHEEIHTGDRPFICSVCGKSFSDRSYLNVHMRVHTNDKRYKCGNCNKSFRQSSHLRRHKRTHTKEKPFKCSYCDKSFSDKNYVKQHEGIHRGEKEFGCSVCGKRFSLRCTLKQHEEIHLKIKSFECNICKKIFCQKRYLSNHMKVHKKENQ